MTLEAQQLISALLPCDGPAPVTLRGCELICEGEVLFNFDAAPRPEQPGLQSNMNAAGEILPGVPLAPELPMRGPSGPLTTIDPDPRVLSRMLQLGIETTQVGFTIAELARDLDLEDKVVIASLLAAKQSGAIEDDNGYFYLTGKAPEPSRPGDETAKTADEWAPDQEGTHAWERDGSIHVHQWGGHPGFAAVVSREDATKLHEQLGVVLFGDALPEATSGLYQTAGFQLSDEQGEPLCHFTWDFLAKLGSIALERGLLPTASLRAVLRWEDAPEAEKTAYLQRVAEAASAEMEELVQGTTPDAYTAGMTAWCNQPSPVRVAETPSTSSPEGDTKA